MTLFFGLGVTGVAAAVVAAGIYVRLSTFTNSLPELLRPWQTPTT